MYDEHETICNQQRNRCEILEWIVGELPVGMRRYDQIAALPDGDRI